MVVRGQDIEYTPGKGRGSRRKGRMGARALIHTDDDGETFYVSVHDTIAGQLTSELPEVSTAFNDLDSADKWAAETLLARKRTWLGTRGPEMEHNEGMKKVFVVFGRQQFAGPWVAIAAFTKRTEANARAKRERMMWDETRVTNLYDYEVKQYLHMARNAEAPPPPRRRRTADPSLRRVRQLVEREERPFEPERRYPRETKPHHFVVNAGLEPWREPDEASEYSAVWYGPGGRSEAEQATEIEGTAGGWYVREYQHLEGYVDEFDPDEPFLVTETHVSLSETLAALDEGGITEPDDPIELMRYAVAFGVADLAERGGSESYASELP
jgi:hypothetical protein